MASVVLTDTRNDDGSGNPVHTYAGVNIDANGGTDIIYIAVGARSVTGLTGATSVTIDGVAAEEIETSSFDEGAGITSTCLLWGVERNDLPDPDQTDVDVVVTFNQLIIRAAAAALVSPDGTLTATATNADTEAGSTAMALSLNTPAAGYLIGVGYFGDTVDADWAGLTEAVDVTVGGANRFTVAIASDVTAETPRTVTLDAVGDMLGAGLSASFAPAGADAAPADTFMMMGV